MQIIVSNNIENEINLFIECLTDTEFISKWPHVGKRLYLMYPDLKKGLILSNDKTQFIREFVKILFKNNESRLGIIVECLQENFDKYLISIKKGLETTMNYKFDSKSIFNVCTSFLPSSTYSKSGANISIIRYLNGDITHEYIDIFIHEMTHIIYVNKFLFIEKKISDMNITSFHYLKEIIAPIILKDTVFDGIRQTENSKYANPEQQLLNIQVNGTIYNLVNYCNNIYIDGKNKGINFDKILINLVGIFKSIQDEIEKKDILFNSLHTGEILYSKEFKEILISNGYSNPIILL